MAKRGGRRADKDNSIVLLKQTLTVRFLLLAAIPLLGCSLQAIAETYPVRPIHIVIPYSPGSPTDIHTRKISDVAQRKLGVSIVVENRPGATGVIGAGFVARAPADGYTLMATPSEPLIPATVLVQSVPYDSVKDFRYITKLFLSAPVLIANSMRGIRTLADLVERSKADPITYASFGPGSFHQLSLEEFARLANIHLQEVSYRSPTQAGEAVLANEVALGYASQSQVLDVSRKDKLVPLAVIGKKRLQFLPAVPTFAEEGFSTRILETAFWTGLVAPRQIPASIVQTLHRAFYDSLQDPEIKDYFSRTGNDTVGNTPDAFDKEFREEYEAITTMLRKPQPVPRP